MVTSSNRTQISQQHHGKALQLFLREELNLSSRQTKTLLDRRTVFVNGKRVWMAKHTLRKGDVVEWPTPDSGKPLTKKEIPILYKDAYLMAVHKPAGLISDLEKNSVEGLLRIQEGNPELRALHRLDKQTSGVLLFLRTAEHREAYLNLFRNKEIQKMYQALLVGPLERDEVTIRKAIDSKQTETHFRVLRRNGNFCKVECEIGTGRLHQIRRHALELGCRVAGDNKYGQHIIISHIEKTLPRQMLHAFSVEFICPQGNNKVKIHAPLPPDFQMAVKKMGL